MKYFHFDFIRLVNLIVCGGKNQPISYLLQIIIYLFKMHVKMIFANKPLKYLFF